MTFAVAPLLLAALAAAPAAGLEAVGVVAVELPPGPDAALAAAARQVRAALAERMGGVLEVEALAARMASQAGAPALEQLERAYAAAIKGYRDDVTLAERLRAIQGRLEALPDGPEAHRQWVRATLRLAKADGDLGRADAARAGLDAVARVAAAVAADPKLYPPEFRQALDAAKARARKLPQAKVTIEAAGAMPGGEAVEVLVDGRKVGVAPLTVALARGRHKVTGAQGKLRSVPVHVDVGERGGAAVVDFAAARSVRADRGPGLALPEENRQRVIAAAGGWLGLDRVVAVAAEGERGGRRIVASMYDVARGTVVRRARLRAEASPPPADAIAGLADFLAKGTASGAVEVVGSAP